MHIIKRTRSICPRCHKEIDADIIEESGKVFMLKSCCGRVFKSLLEKDATLYKELVNISLIKNRLKFKHLILPITTKCNLNCPVCYEDFDKLDLTVDEIKRIDFDGESIAISGGEPTVRRDLEKIIRVVSAQCTPVLVTNGKLLSHLNYLSKLKRAGLNWVVFSFNSFNDEIYKKINGERLLKVKLKALKNIKRLKMKTILSVLLVKGVNENQLKDIMKFAIKNRDFVREVRIRTQAPFGRYIKTRKMMISEMIDLLSKFMNLKTEEILTELKLRRFIDELIGKTFIHRPCSLTFHLKVDGEKVIPLGKLIKLNESNSRFSKLITILHFFRVVGLKIIARWFLNKFDLTKTFIDSKEFIAVGLRVWYDKSDIDLDEIKRCQTAYLDGRKLLPFCYVNAMRN